MATTYGSRKAIFGYEGLYEIFDDGRVFAYPQNSNNNVKGRFLSPVLPRDNGYSRVSLYKHGKPKCHQISRLVASHFICKKPFENAQVNHIDGNKSNNHVSNLEWVTPSENILHAYRTGLKTAKGDKNGRRLHLIRLGLVK